jgi:ribonucleoside-diphosphate reductase beta chain
LKTGKDQVVNEFYFLGNNMDFDMTTTDSNIVNENRHNELSELEKEEYLLKENPNRFVIFPIQDQEIWDYYKKAQGSFWKVEEIKNISQDLVDWETKLDSDEKHFIKMILAFFANTDGIVNENLAARFMTEVQSPEVRSFYGFQIAIENIHGEMYSLLIDTYIKDATEKLFLLRAIHNIDSIKALSGWALKWINSGKSFATRLVAFACVEGIFFSGPFCAIFWLKKRGLMPALTASNEFISRDEALHCEFACLLYGYLEKTRLDQSVVYQIVEEAVAFEKQFITESLPCRLIGMNAHSMCTYIEFCADRLIMMLGYPALWNAQNPYDFMNNIGLDGKTNFFEKNTTEYSQSGFEEGASHIITLHDDF